MLDEEVQELARLVRLGMGLRQAIEDRGLPAKQTLLHLKKNHRAVFKQAKLEAVFVAATSEAANKLCDAIDADFKKQFSK